MSESDENECCEGCKYLDSVKLEEITNELNANCISLKRPKEKGYYNFTSYEWETYELADIIYELHPLVNDVPRRFDPITFSKLSKYCYIENEYSCYEAKGLCKSCKSIFKEKIIKVFCRNSLELNIELTETKKELLDIKSAFADLKKQIETITKDLANDITKKMDDI